MIAPTGVAANGEHVVPIKRLSPEQVKQVKTQILMAKAEAAAASTAAMTAGRAAAEPGSHAAHDGEEPSESDEPGHRGTPSHPVASSSFGVGLEDDDPWMTPITPVPPMSSPRKHVAVPDLSDDDDPWAHPMPASQVPASDAVSGTASDAASSRDVSQASSFPQQASQPSAASSSSPVMSGISLRARPRIPHRRTTRGQRFPAAGGFGAPAVEAAESAAGSSGPQVDPDEDEYSLSDESLGTATALSVEELSKIFEVKKVEKFAADDPKNPRNAQPPKHGMGVICRIAGEPITGTNWYAAHPHIRRSNCSPPHIPRLRGH